MCRYQHRCDTGDSSSVERDLHRWPSREGAYRARGAPAEKVLRVR